MEDDIKEILDKITDEDWYEEKDLTGTKWIELKQEETNLLYDYITNLEEKYDKALTDLVQESHTRMELENKITNLQKIIKQRDKDIETLLKTIKVDNNKITNLEEENQIEKYKTLKDLQDRIDKAIIFLKEAQEGLEEYHFDGYDPCLNECINILKGDKDE